MQAAHYWDATLNIPMHSKINLSIEVRVEGERMIKNEQYIAAVAAVQKFANAQLSEAKACVDELKKPKSFH